MRAFRISLVALALLTGCVTNPPSDRPPGQQSASPNERPRSTPEVVSVQDASRKKGPKIPTGYGEPGRPLVLAVSVSDGYDRKGRPGSIQANLSSFLQAELGRINRFRTFGLFNDNTWRLLNDLEGIGEIEVVRKKKPKVDLELSGMLWSTVKRTDLHNGNVGYNYQTTAVLELRNGERTAIWSENIEGQVKRAVTVIGSDGRRIGGHDPDDPESREALLKESLQDVMSEVVERLGRAFPVNANVTGSFAGRVAIDRGTAHGMIPDMPCVLWYRGPSNVALPLLKGTVEPGRTTSTVVFERWASSDPYAAKLLQEIAASETWVSDHPGTLFVTSEGLSLPR